MVLVSYRYNRYPGCTTRTSVPSQPEKQTNLPANLPYKLTLQKVTSRPTKRNRPTKSNKPTLQTYLTKSNRPTKSKPSYKKQTVLQYVSQTNQTNSKKKQKNTVKNKDQTVLQRVTVKQKNLQEEERNRKIRK